MNLLAWLDALSNASAPDTGPRRAALARLGRAAVATVPAVALASRATAGPPRTQSFLTIALNLVLRVAQTQQALLNGALAAGATPFPTTADRTRFEAFQTLTNDLVTRVRAAIEDSGDAAEAPLNYDFTGGQSSTHSGPLQPFSSYNDFLGEAQALADLLSRTLISTLGPLVGAGTFVELVAQLLGTNSRMAALIRRSAAATPWVVDNNSAPAPVPVPVLLARVYAGEETTKQLSLNLTSTGTTAVLPSPVPAVSVLTSAFDEPLTQTTSDTELKAAVYAVIALLTY